jgi:hypothetical protein
VKKHFLSILGVTVIQEYCPRNRSLADAGCAMSSLQRLWNLIDTKNHTKHHRSENCHLIATF